jgi:hypothetical protein
VESAATKWSLQPYHLTPQITSVGGYRRPLILAPFLVMYACFSHRTRAVGHSQQTTDDNHRGLCVLDPVLHRSSLQQSDQNPLESRVWKTGPPSSQAEAHVLCWFDWRVDFRPAQKQRCDQAPGQVTKEECGLDCCTLVCALCFCFSGCLPSFFAC